MSTESAIREAAGHITGAAATVEVVANELRAALREGRFDAFRTDRQFWRYLFAGMAMQGALADHQPEPGWVIKQADALLAELERREGEGDG